MPACPTARMPDRPHTSSPPAILLAGGIAMWIVTVTREQLVRRLGFLMLLAFLVGLTSAAGSASLRPAAADPADTPLTRAESPDDRLALTFDATWGKDELGRITEILAQHDVKATFFVGGTFLSLHGEQIKRLAAAGHEIGTLGQKIVDLSSLTEQEVTSNLLAAQSTLSRNLGGPARWFRPPQGPATPEVVRGARAAGLVTVTHSLDSEDDEGLRSEEITRRILRRARRGDVILLSASDWSKETAKALPAIIEGLKKRGFKLVTVSDLVPGGEERSR